MMAIRINNIRINRGGPLKEDFILAPGDVNLIYGHNETGKTYVVESIIGLLFRARKKPSVDWKLRKWDSSGKISISGLDDKTISFTKAGKRLEDYWSEEIGLPQDFSRLLVVKAGETLLSQEVDGVGRDILKSYLSGEGLLDEIARAISPTIQKSQFENGEIIGSNQGELRKREQYRNELNQIDSLLKEAEDAYASGDLYILRQTQEVLKEQLELQNKAKCYYAACKYKDKEKLRHEKDGLPSGEDLSEIESDISVYEKSRTIVERKLKELSRVESTEDDYRWTEKAKEIYQELATKAVKHPTIIYIALILIALLGTVITGIVNLTIPFVISIAALLFSLILYYRSMRKTMTSTGDNLELDKVKEDYRNRFNTELTSVATLEARIESLKENYISARDLRRDLEENLIPESKTNESYLMMRLKAMTGRDISSQEWRPAISEIKTRLNKLDKEINSLNVELASLAIPEEDFLNQDPGVEWNISDYDELRKAFQDTSDLLEQKLRDLERLKSRVSQEAHLESDNWEELITALQEKRDDKAQQYKQVTAEILAKIQAFKIVQEYREEENIRISAGLEREELIKPLYAVTGRYNKIRHEVDSGLVLTTDDDNEYPLSEISTGAKEQIFLALRMGFSSIAMKGQPAFLILDDAFQHSDWIRRGNLVDQILGLAHHDWQILYFTMDDHIRGLFLKGGEILGENFKSKELF